MYYHQISLFLQLLYIIQYILYNNNDVKMMIDVCWKKHKQEDEKGEKL